MQPTTSVPPISELGPDALLEPMKIDEFMNALSKKKISIKALLLDQVRCNFPPLFLICYCNIYDNNLCVLVQYKRHQIIY